MALLERVATLIRANLNDLIEKSEDPEKLIKQVILDMRNQLLQVKTQVAIAIADRQLLEKKREDAEAKTAEWTRKAELAVDKQDDELARAALERSIASQRTADNFRQQCEDQKLQVENLKSALSKLDAKLSEAQTKSEILIAEHRRARLIGRAAEARKKMDGHANDPAFEKLQKKAAKADADGAAHSSLEGYNIEDRLAALDREQEIEALLRDLKSRRG
jgi:phage shock protein A